MDPIITDSLGVAAGLLGGWIIKRTSKKKDSDVHKILSPLTATLVATAVQALGADQETAIQVMAAGASGGGVAVAIHSVFKNVGQWLDKRL